MIRLLIKLLLFVGLFTIVACNSRNDAKQKDTDLSGEEGVILEESIKDSIGTISTTMPVTQSRGESIYNWADRHEEILAMNKQRPPKIVFIGNSILHYWGGEPLAPIRRGVDSWDQYFKPKDVRNLGFGWDRIENVLWRVHHGELDGYDATHIVVLIGTNNLLVNTDTQIVEGIDFLVQVIRHRQPAAKIILMGILPRQYYEPRLEGINPRIAGVASKLGVTYADAGGIFLGDDGTINESLFSDGVHPNAEGYRLLAPFIDGYLD